MKLSAVLLAAGLFFVGVWLLTTLADPSSAVGYVGRVAWSLAVGCVVGGALRWLWEGR